LAGYWFGNLPQVKKYFHLVIIGLVVVSLLPVAWQLIAGRRSQRSPQLSDV
jgi:membrane-associated protein